MLAEEKITECPRILIAGTKSNCGKTIVSIGLLRIWKKKGLKPTAFKCGPDYIDPLYHAAVTGESGYHLDSFFCPKEGLCERLRDKVKENGIALIEGVMGYYDGLGTKGATGASDIASLTGTPTVLILDGAGRSRSVLAELRGFLDFAPEGKQIRGVIFNRLSEKLYNGLCEEVRAMGVLPLGYLPKSDVFHFGDRHLGLRLPLEDAEFEKKAERIAAEVSKTIDVEGLECLAKAAAPLPGLGEKREICGESKNSLRIAVARDAAFSFFYRENAEYFEHLGCQIRWFSPMADSRLPECDGLYLPGGYPEVYAKALSENVSMLKDIKEKISGGLPVIAECGGYIYLHEALVTKEGERFPMAGALRGTCYYKGFQKTFGYVTMETETDGILGPAGTRVRGHEFHYFASDRNDANLRLDKPDGDRGWRGGVLTPSMYAGFPHLWLSGTQAGAAFVDAMRKAALEKRSTTNETVSELEGADRSL